MNAIIYRERRNDHKNCIEKDRKYCKKNYEIVTPYMMEDKSYSLLINDS